jgi:hypothetical protein
MFNSSTNRDEASDSARRGTILQDRQQDSCQKENNEKIQVNRGSGWYVTNCVRVSDKLCEKKKRMEVSPSSSCLSAYFD